MSRFGVSPGGSGRLSDEQFAELMAEPILATLGTTTEDGFPWIVPVWFEGDGEAAWLLCRGKAAVAGHLAARLQVALLVDRRDERQTRALLLGEAEVVAGPVPLAQDARMRTVAERLAVRYSGEAGRSYIEQSIEWPRALVRIIPTRIVSWGVVDWHPRYYG